MGSWGQGGSWLPEDLAYLTEWAERLGLAGHLRWTMGGRVTLAGCLGRGPDHVRSGGQGHVRGHSSPTVVSLAWRGERSCHGG